MKKRKIKLMAALLSVTTLCTVFSGTALAAQSDSWDVTYAKGAPSGTVHPTDTLALSYYPGGYRAKARKLTGSADRYVKITCSYPGGMSPSPIRLTTTNQYSKLWKVKNNSNSVTFKVTAGGSENCSSTGTIYGYD